MQTNERLRQITFLQSFLPNYNAKSKYNNQIIVLIFYCLQFLQSSHLVRISNDHATDLYQTLLVFHICWYKGLKVHAKGLLDSMSHNYLEDHHVKPWKHKNVQVFRGCASTQYTHTSRGPVHWSLTNQNSITSLSSECSMRNWKVNEQGGFNCFFLNTWPMNSTTPFKSSVFQNLYSKRSSVGIFYSWNWTINRDIISLIDCRDHTLFKYPALARGCNDNSEITRIPLGAICQSSAQGSGFSCCN